MADTAATTNIELAVDLVSAYVGNNAIPSSELTKLLVDVHSTLTHICAQAPHTHEEPQKPSVSARRSVTDEHLVCLEDGKHFKSLRRHLNTEHKMSPEQYRAKWNLPNDYPMVARHFSKHRSKLAKQSGLGLRRKSKA
jgi:predicted transcriptional regulator